MKYIASVIYDAGNYYQDEQAADRQGGRQLSLSTLLYTVPVMEYIRRETYDYLIDIRDNKNGKIPTGIYGEVHQDINIVNNEIWLEKFYNAHTGGRLREQTIDSFMDENEKYNSGGSSFSSNKTPLDIEKLQGRWSDRIIKDYAPIENIFAFYATKHFNLQYPSDIKHAESIVFGFKEKKENISLDIKDIDAQCVAAYRNMSKEEQELFAPYIQKGKIDKHFDDSYMPEEEKKENEYYINSVDLALKLQRDAFN